MKTVWDQQQQHKGVYDTITMAATAVPKGVVPKSADNADTANYGCNADDLMQHVDKSDNADTTVAIQWAMRLI